MINKKYFMMSLVIGVGLSVAFVLNYYHPSSDFPIWIGYVTGATAGLFYD